MKQTDIYAPFLLIEAEYRAEVNSIAQDLEKTFARHGIHLSTDDFNTLHDFVSVTMLRIRENGE